MLEHSVRISTARALLRWRGWEAALRREVLVESTAEVVARTITKAATVLDGTRAAHRSHDWRRPHLVEEEVHV